MFLKSAPRLSSLIELRSPRDPEGGGQPVGLRAASVYRHGGSPQKPADPPPKKPVDLGTAKSIIIIDQYAVEAPVGAVSSVAASPDV